MIAEYDGAGALHTLDPERSWIYAPGTDRPIAYVDHANGDALRFIHQDRLGNVVSVTNRDGTVFNNERFAYDAFGNLAPGTPAGGMPLRYTGRWDDEGEGGMRMIL